MGDETVAGGIDYGYFGTPHLSGSRLSLEYIKSLHLEEKVDQLNTTEVDEIWKTFECLVDNKGQKSRKSRSKSTGAMNAVEQNKENVPPSRRSTAANDVNKENEDATGDAEQENKVVRKRGRPPKSSKVPCSPKPAESEAANSPAKQNGSTPTRKPGASAKKNTKAKTSDKSNNVDGSKQLPVEGQPSEKGSDSPKTQKTSRKSIAKPVEKPADSEKTEKELKKPRGRPRKSLPATENAGDSQPSQQLENGDEASGGATATGGVDTIREELESLSFVGPSQEQQSPETSQLVRIEALNGPEKPVKNRRRTKSAVELSLQRDASVEPQVASKTVVSRKSLIKETAKIVAISAVSLDKQAIESMRGRSDALSIAGPSQTQQLEPTKNTPEEEPVKNIKRRQSVCKSPVQSHEQLDTVQQSTSPQRIAVGNGAIKKTTVQNAKQKRKSQVGPSVSAKHQEEPSSQIGNPQIMALVAEVLNDTVNSNASSNSSKKRRRRRRKKNKSAAGQSQTQGWTVGNNSSLSTPASVSDSHQRPTWHVITPNPETPGTFVSQTTSKTVDNNEPDNSFKIPLPLKKPRVKKAISWNNPCVDEVNAMSTFSEDSDGTGITSNITDLSNREGTSYCQTSASENELASSTSQGNFHQQTLYQNEGTDTGESFTNTIVEMERIRAKYRQETSRVPDSIVSRPSTSRGHLQNQTGASVNTLPAAIVPVHDQRPQRSTEASTLKIVEKKRTAVEKKGAKPVKISGKTEESKQQKQEKQRQRNEKKRLHEKKVAAKNKRRTHLERQMERKAWLEKKIQGKKDRKMGQALVEFSKCFVKVARKMGYAAHNDETSSDSSSCCCGNSSSNSSECECCYCLCNSSCSCSSTSSSSSCNCSDCCPCLSSSCSCSECCLSSTTDTSELDSSSDSDY